MVVSYTNTIMKHCNTCTATCVIPCGEGHGGREQDSPSGGRGGRGCGGVRGGREYGTRSGHRRGEDNSPPSHQRQQPPVRPTLETNEKNIDRIINLSKEESL